MSNRWRTALLYALLCFIWGSTWLAIRLGLHGMPPVFAAALRMLISGALLLALALLLRVKFAPTRLLAAQILVQGAGQFGINFALIYWAEQSVPSGLTAVLFAVTPMLTAMSAAFFFRIERLSLVNYGGLVLGFCGVAVIYWAEVIQTAHVPALGVVAVLAASLLVSNASVFAKRWSERFTPLAIVSGGQLCGGAVLSAIALLTERGNQISLNAYSVGALAYLTIFGSGIAYMTYFYLLRTMSVTQLSLVTYITPVLAIVLGALSLHEVLAASTFVGAALVFLGISLVYRKSAAAAPVAAASSLSNT